MLQLVDLAETADRLPAQLSGGQQQRVAIARSLVLEPQILMFDEPLSNLDFKLRVQMRDELRSLQRRLGKTSIYVTHDQTEALALSDRIAVLSHGQIEQIGTPAEIYEAPATSFVAEFIGSSNLFEARVVERYGAGAIVETAAGLRLCCDGANQRAATDLGQVWVMLRPEHVRLRAPAGETAAPELFCRRDRRGDVSRRRPALHARYDRRAEAARGGEERWCGKRADRDAAGGNRCRSRRHPHPRPLKAVWVGVPEGGRSGPCWRAPMRCSCWFF